MLLDITNKIQLPKKQMNQLYAHVNLIHPMLCWRPGKVFGVQLYKINARVLLCVFWVSSALIGYNMRVV